MPQVLCRLAELVMLLGSDEGRILWKPWQLAQLATVTSPRAERDPVIGVIVTVQPVRGQAVLGGQRHIVVAAGTNYRHLLRADRAGRVLGAADIVFAVTVGAKRNILIAVQIVFPVNSLDIVLVDRCVGTCRRSPGFRAASR